jgi:hypothetical protein
MDEGVRQKLRDLIARYGRSICDNPAKCQSLIADICGDHRLELNLLVAALRAGIPIKLPASHAGIPPEMRCAQLASQLQKDQGLSADAAHWAVDSWALALGVIAVPTSAKPAVEQQPAGTKLADAPPGSYRAKIDAKTAAKPDARPPPPTARTTASPPPPPKRTAATTKTTSGWLLGFLTTAVVMAFIWWQNRAPSLPASRPSPAATCPDRYLTDNGQSLRPDQLPRPPDCRLPPGACYPPTVLHGPFASMGPVCRDNE